MPRVIPVVVCMGLAMVAGCGRPDGRALQTLACQQVANSIDLQSMAQLDTLRKALGVAPGVDPLQTCRALGVTLEASPQSGAASSDGGASSDNEGEN